MLKTINYKLLDEQEKKEFMKLFNEYSKKIVRKLKKIDSFIVYFKEYEKEGKRKKYSIRVKVIAARIFEGHAADWDFKRTVHKVFNKLDEEIENRFHISDQSKR